MACRGYTVLRFILSFLSEGKSNEKKKDATVAMVIKLEMGKDKE